VTGPLDIIASLGNWLLSWLPKKAATPAPKKPLTPAELGWTTEATKPSKPPPRAAS